MDFEDILETLLKGDQPEVSEVRTSQDYTELDGLLSDHVTALPTPPREDDADSSIFSPNSECSFESLMTHIDDLDLQSLLLDPLEDSLPLCEGALQEVTVNGTQHSIPHASHNVDISMSLSETLDIGKRLLSLTDDYDDILDTFLEECQSDNILYDGCPLQPKIHAPPSTSAPAGGFETPPCSPDMNDEIPCSPDNSSESPGVAEQAVEPSRSSPVFRCQFCDRSFKHKIGLKNHERSHLRGETHVCGFCGESFRYKNKLRRHVNVHAKQLRICRYCGLVQINDYEFVQHEKRHKLEESRGASDCVPRVGLFNRPVVGDGTPVGVMGAEDPGTPRSVDRIGLPLSASGRIGGRLHPYIRPIRHNSV